jgi:putative NIF3 family GTP cyclohydrolase 1 type 2
VTGVEGFEDAGYGRIVRFQSPQRLGTLVQRINAGLGNLPGLSVATPQDVPSAMKADIAISSVGICAGSGGSVLAGIDVDLLFTGELSHHEALPNIELGRCVITAFHSNSERKFLGDVMKDKLYNVLKEDVIDVDVVVSKADKDPYEIVPAGSWS